MSKKQKPLIVIIFFPSFAVVVLIIEDLIGDHIKGEEEEEK